MSSSLLPLRQIYAAVQEQRPADMVIGDVVALLRSLASGDPHQSKQEMVTQQHPLGFFVCKWSLGEGQTLRLHFWSKDFQWAQEPGWEIHDHVFSFTSLVMLGRLRSRTFEISDSPIATPRHTVYEVSYTDKDSAMVQSHSGVSLCLKTDTVEETGTSYTMSAGVLHCSELISGVALTILAAKDETTDFAAPRVVSEHQMDKVNFNRAPSAELNVSGLFSRFADELDS